MTWTDCMLGSIEARQTALQARWNRLGAFMISEGVGEGDGENVDRVGALLVEMNRLHDLRRYLLERGVR